MRIGFDYTAAVSQGAGIGRYARELFAGISAAGSGHEFVLLYPKNALGDRERALPVVPGVSERPVRLSERTLSILWHRLRLPLPVERFVGRLDLFHSPDFGLPPLRSSRGLVTVHDLSFLLFPDCHEKTLREYLERMVPRSVRRATVTLADSKNTLNDVVCLLDVDPKNVRLVYPGVDTRFRRVTAEDKLAAVRDKYHLGYPFLLFVGMIEPRKNLPRLVQAYARLREQTKCDHRLVIAGRRGWLCEGVFRQVADLNLQDQVHFIGYVPDEDLPALYSLAEVFVFPSLYEGFGLPVLEAMACGTPVVTSKTSSLPEIVGDAGLLIDPGDEEDLRAALARLLSDAELRRTLGEAGVARSGVFTWDAAAKSVLAIYAELAGAC